MEESIFSNRFSLKFKKFEIEKEYYNKRQLSLSSLNLFIIIILVILNILSTTLTIIFTQNEIRPFWLILRYTAIISTSLNIVVLFICIFCKNMNIIRWIHYLAYLLLFFTLSNTFNVLSSKLQVSLNLMNIASLVEIILRMFFSVFTIHSFLENIILNGITCVFIWVLYLPALDKSIVLLATYVQLAYTATFSILVGFSYVLDKQQKNAFYFQYTHAKKLEWLTNVFENMNTGFLSIKGNKITYMNSFVQNKLMQQLCKVYQEKNTLTEAALLVKESKQQFEDLDNFTKNEIKKIYMEDTNSFLMSLLSNINLDSINNKNFNNKFTDFIKEFSLNSHYDINENKREYFLQNFIKCIKDFPGVNNFVLIGDKKLEIDDAEYHYEIFCRYNHSQTSEDELDFLLNDVTRTKLIEKHNAEFKYKTIFLSKVAHEFKNPLICIIELINQLSENLKLKNDAIKTVSQIKSMSNFLLVLVKDLNYFSESQIGKKLEIENKEVDLNEILDFCREISESLILKSNKSNSVKFEIIKKDTPLKIFVDEWRLKQVLINLISNAIKFTNYGKVNLEVSCENNFDTNEMQNIKFCVTDSGVGIKEQNYDKLFIPFYKLKNKNNELGSGLGLSIASEISENLGGKLQFTSIYQKGTSFWFTIPNKKFSSFSNIKNFEVKEESKTSISNDLEMDINSEKDEKYMLNSPYNFKTHTKNSSRNLLYNSKNEEHNFKNKCTSSQSSKGSILNKTISNAKLYPHINSYFNKYSVLNLFYPDIFSNIRSENKSNTVKLTTPQIQIECYESMNIIVVDDESFIRQSSIRILQKISDKLNIKLNIIEADDGIECLYIVYKCITQGIKISMIFSDENMLFIKGSKCSEILWEILNIKNISSIPFFLVTAYDNSMKDIFKSKYVTDILSKPLSRDVAQNLIQKFLINN